MSTLTPVRAHVIIGGFPPGAAAGHDMDYARLRLLQLLHEQPYVRTTVANDFTDIATWLPDSQLLLTYVAGPYLNDAQNDVVRQWLEAGGRWFALHGTSGGKAVRLGEDRRLKKMVKTSHHDTLGSFFLNHPPLRKFQVTVTDRDHVLTRGLPASFEVIDELYLIELQAPAASHVLLTTELARDPSPPASGLSTTRTPLSCQMARHVCWGTPARWVRGVWRISRSATVIPQPPIGHAWWTPVRRSREACRRSFVAPGRRSHLSVCCATALPGALGENTFKADSFCPPLLVRARARVRGVPQP